MIKYELSIAQYNEGDITDFVFGDLTIEKERFDLPQIGNSVKLTGQMVLSGEAYQKLLDYNIDNATQGNLAEVVILIYDTEMLNFYEYYIDTKTIKWDKERCFAIVNDGSLGGLQKINDDLKKVWSDEVVLSGLGTDLDISKTQYKVRRTQTNTIDDWDVWNVTNVDNYWDKVDGGGSGVVVTGTEKTNVLNVINNDNDLLSKVVGEDLAIDLPEVGGQFNFKTYWIVENDEVLEPTIRLHYNQYQTATQEITRSYHNFKGSINEDCKLVDAIDLRDAINHILSEYGFSNIQLDDDIYQFLGYNFNPTSSNLFKLVQRSNAKRPWGEKKAKNYKISLQSLLNDLCTIFRCYWFISKVEGTANYKLSVFNPRFQFTTHANIAKDFKVNGLYSPYVYNAYEIQDVETLNIYEFVGDVPEYRIVEMEQNARIETLRNATKESNSNGGVEVKKISQFSTDWRGLVFLDFGKDSPFTVDYGESENLDLPIMNNDIRLRMEDVSNQFFADDGFLLYNEKYTNIGQRVNNHNATLPHLGREETLFWDNGGFDNRIYDASGGIKEMVIKEIEEVQMVNCGLVPEEMEVMEKNGEWYFAKSSSFSINTGILSIKFEKK